MESFIRTAKRTGAIGKAILVYMGSGSIVAAIAVYLIASTMGC
jgi:hypothetical protein